MNKRLLAAAALLGVSVLSSSASSAPLRYCDTACPNTVSRAGCWYE